MLKRAIYSKLIVIREGRKEAAPFTLIALQRVLYQLNRPESCRKAGRVHDKSVRAKEDDHRVERLGAEAVWPPQLGIYHLQSGDSLVDLFLRITEGNSSADGGTD